MKKFPKISIILPFYFIEDRTFSDLKRYKRLDYPNFEIVVVSDKKVDIKDPKVRLVLTGKRRTGPAEKRDVALKVVKSELCAFIDDDAYPDPSWLKNAVVHFRHPQIAAVGGPGVTPKEDGFWEQMSGLVYMSILCGGPTQHRFARAKMAFVDDFPAYNLIIRTDVLKSIGGWGTHFYGGEDTFLCLKIIKAGWKILYDPEVVVYHHRRRLGMPLFLQIANIGKHRGYFAKRFPETSLIFYYFLPSIATLGFFSLLSLSFFSKTFLFVFVSLLIFAFFIAAVSIIRKTTLFKSLLVAFGIIGTHIAYGLAFIKGLWIRDLER